MKAVSAQVGELLCFWQTPKIMQHKHHNIPYMIDCWADPFVHLLQVWPDLAIFKVLDDKFSYNGSQNIWWPFGLAWKPSLFK